MSQSASRPAISETRTATFGAMLVALGPISMALYTPAMPTLVTVFGTSMSAVKLTLTSYFLGFALAQLICGPLSDAFGRRPITLLFLSIYVLASIAAFFSPTVELLTLSRLIQGVGAAAGVSISRAIVRDSYVGEPAAKIMNMIGIWLALGPALSPSIGGLLLDLVNWQAIFIVMILYGAALVTTIALMLPETNRNLDRQRAHPRQLASAYGVLIRDVRFLKPSLIMGLTVGGLYALSTMLPFILIDRVGLTPTEFGAGMMLQSGAFIAGGIATRQLLKGGAAERLVRPGLIGGAVGGLLLLISLWTLPLSLWSVMLPVAVFTFTLAMIMPAMSINALAPFPKMAGAASALMGFIQMGSGFAGSAVAALIGDPVTAIMIILPGMTIGGLVLFLALPQTEVRHSA